MRLDGKKARRYWQRSVKLHPLECESWKRDNTLRVGKSALKKSVTAVFESM
jgi:hypothetical protein